MIRLTFVCDGVRGFVEEHDTDDLAEALIAEAKRSFRLKPEQQGALSNRGPEKWVISWIVERDGAVMTQDEIVKAYQTIASLQQVLPAERHTRPAATPGARA